VRLLAVASLAGASGCGGTATVTGTVSYQGQPVTHGSVTFRSADGAARSAPILADGSYTVEGVHTGEVKVGIISRDPDKGRSTSKKNGKSSTPIKMGQKSVPPGKKGDEQKKSPVPGWFPLPHNYENPETSGLGCTVGAGRSEYKIVLK
jgi:hypothetical protein